MHFLTYIFISVLVSRPTFCHWESEENLLNILKKDIKVRQALLTKSTRYLESLATANGSLESYFYHKYIELNRNISGDFWMSFQYVKGIVVDWENFWKYLDQWPRLPGQVHQELSKHSRGVMTDYLLEENDYKLINFVKGILKSKRAFEPNNAALQKLHKKRFGKTAHNFRESLKDFMRITNFVEPGDYVDRGLYEKLCRGEVEVAYNSLFLKCRYFHNDNPYLIIGPFKVEELYGDPAIYLYHDVLTNSEIETIKAKALLHHMHISQGTETFYRVAKVTWLTDDALKSVSLRTSLMTNLDINFSEMLQVAVYGIAGHYEPHYDADTNHADDTSNRISTVLFYLDDNFRGGATVFPTLNLTVLPKKGSAVVWHNLQANFELDYRTLHAGCPLYSGVKWVLNSWIAVKGQEFRVPCDAKAPGSFMIGKPHAAAE